MADHPDWNCPHCEECDGCGGGDGSDPRNPMLDRSRPGVVLLTCGDCNGDHAAYLRQQLVPYYGHTRWAATATRPAHALATR